MALGDKIVAIDGQRVENYAQIRASLAAHPDKPLKLTVQLAPTDKADSGTKDAARRKILPNSSPFASPPTLCAGLVW